MSSQLLNVSTDLYCVFSEKNKTDKQVTHYSMSNLININIKLKGKKKERHLLLLSILFRNYKGFFHTIC